MTDVITAEKVLTPRKTALQHANTKAHVLLEEGELDSEIDLEEEVDSFMTYLENNGEFLSSDMQQVMEEKVDTVSKNEVREVLGECYLTIRNVLVKKEARKSEDDGLGGAED